MVVVVCKCSKFVCTAGFDKRPSVKEMESAGFGNGCEENKSFSLLVDVDKRMKTKINRISK